MRKKVKNSALLKQRVTLLLVLFFCMLVTTVEYFPNVPSKKSDSSKELSQETDASNENQTFLNVAVDAVVPFVIVVSQQVFYLIYENKTTDAPHSDGERITLPLNFPYWEILLERIISPNAP